MRLLGSAGPGRDRRYCASGESRQGLKEKRWGVGFASEESQVAEGPSMEYGTAFQSRGVGLVLGGLVARAVGAAS